MFERGRGLGSSVVGAVASGRSHGCTVCNEENKEKNMEEVKKRKRKKEENVVCEKKVFGGRREQREIHGDIPKKD